MRVRMRLLVKIDASVKKEGRRRVVMLVLVIIWRWRIGELMEVLLILRVLVLLVRLMVVDE